MYPGDERYLGKDWRAALALYSDAARLDPALSAQLSLPLLIAHCRIELADDPASLPLPTDLPAPVRTAREDYSIKVLRARALELCRAGDPVRASSVLRLMACYDDTLATAYRRNFAAGRSDEAAVAGEPPRFLGALGIDALPVDAIKRRHRGERVLLVYRRFFPEGDGRRGEVINCLAVTAERFGLSATPFAFRDQDPGALASALLREILAVKPDLIVYDHRVPDSVSPEPALARQQIESVFETARRELGVRVVISFMDAWEQLRVGAAELYRGVGRAFDLLQHGHPAALDIGSPEQAARTFCYTLPAWLPDPPAVAPGTIARACFAGSIAWFNYTRVAWWAETARRGLPIDFLETLHHEGPPRSDRAYAELLAQYQIALNFTARTGDLRIMTGRTLDVPLAGGVLVEEHTENTDFFLSPGTHYVPFTTLDDLAAVLAALLADPVRRERIRCAGQRWVETYFTGDHFWAGLLHRLDALR